MVCCNCANKKGWYGDPKGKPGTFFECSCQCHITGKYPDKKQKAYEKRHPENNPKVKEFPKWFENDKKQKQQIQRDNKAQKE